MSDEIQAGHHRFPHLCARCGTEKVAGLWPLPVQVKPQIHAASLLTIFAGRVVFEQKEKIVAVPVCAACGAWLTQQKKVDSWFSRLTTVGVMIGILGGIPVAIGWMPSDRLNGLIMALCMAGGAVVGVVGAYLLTGLLFGRLPLWKGVTFCTWDGEELHFENATFRERYQTILAR
ncbi:MAG: hypothetical protein R3E79_10125 [Caldilineaceae bacterium]